MHQLSSHHFVSFIVAVAVVVSAVVVAFVVVVIEASNSKWKTSMLTTPLLSLSFSLFLSR